MDWKLIKLPTCEFCLLEEKKLLTLLFPIPPIKNGSRIFPVCDVFQNSIFLEALVVAFAKIVIYSWQHVEWPDLQ
jgi:hypothetical protein